MYQQTFEHAAQRAGELRDYANSLGDADSAAHWNQIADRNAAQAIERGTVANDAWVKSLAKKSAGALADLGGPLGYVADLMEIKQAVESGNLNELGKVCTGILMGMLFAEFGAYLAMSMFAMTPIGAALLAASFAVGGDLVGKALWDYWGEWLSDRVSDMFSGSINWRQRRDPLVFDLDGDGIETVGFNAANPILFDHDADGVCHRHGLDQQRRWLPRLRPQR